MYKGILTNLIAALVFGVGYFFQIPVLFSMGAYALSGALTNQLAIHMLFEKVPGFYGTGVIQLRFEAFKQSIKSLMMREFFSQTQLQTAISSEVVQCISHFDLNVLLEQIDFSKVFEKLMQAILNSEQGAMLSLMGGRDLLMSFKDKFVAALQSSLKSSFQSEQFNVHLMNAIQAQIKLASEPKVDFIEVMIDDRLSQLTAQAVKKILSDLIHEHLGWLVVWGGVLGASIGLFSHVLRYGFL